MSSTSVPLLAATGALLLSLGLTGCDEFINAVQQAGEAAQDASAAPADAPMSEDEKLGVKLSGYIECTNNTSRRVLDSADRYASWVDPATGLTGKEKHIYGLYKVDGQKRCIDGIKTSNDAEPDDAAIEAAATAYGDALGEVQPLIAAAYAYYQEKNYKDDAFAKGKELDPKLKAAFAKFAEADIKLRTEVRTRNEDLLKRELERVEKEEGRKLLFHSKNVMAEAKHVVEASDVPDFHDLDLEKFEAALKAFEAALKECETYAKAHKAETDSVTMFSSFTSEATELKMAGKELMRRKRDNKEYSSSEKSRAQSSPENVEGHPRKVGKAYNDLVNRSNSLNWHWYKPDP